jgi:hypothetical protein
MPTYRTDVFISEPMAAYKARRAEYLTSHQLSEFRACPLLYRKSMAGLVARFFSEAFLIGAATHTLTLEGRAAFEREYVVGGPINDKTGKPYGSETKKFAEWAKSTGKTALSDSQFALACNMSTAVRSHKLAAALLSRGVAEGVLRVNDYCGAACQIRVDWFNDLAGIVDLKTCEDLDQFAGQISDVQAGDNSDGDCPRWFVQNTGDVRKYHYPEQMGFYRGVYRAATDATVPAHLIAVEKREPFRVGVFRLSDDLLGAAEIGNRASIKRLIECRRTNLWPTNYEELRIIAA